MEIQKAINKSGHDIIMGHKRWQCQLCFDSAPLPNLVNLDLTLVKGGAAIPLGQGFTISL